MGKLNHKFLSMRTAVVIVALVLIVGVGWLLYSEEKEEEVLSTAQENETNELQAENGIVFISPDTRDDVVVAFSGGQASLTGLTYENEPLSRVEAASGAKYANNSGSLVVWNKGQELTIYENDTVVFVGLTEDALTDSYIHESLTTTSEEVAIDVSGTWSWVRTKRAEEMLVPHTAEEFTVTFADGSMQGTTDCNTFFGSYTYAENILIPGVMGMTKKFCAESQESDFVASFEQPMVATLNEDNQLVLTNGGAGIRVVLSQ